MKIPMGNLTEVIEQYLSKEGAIKKKEGEIKEIEKAPPKVSAQKNGRYTIDSAEQLIQYVNKMEDENKSLEGLKMDLKELFASIERLLQQIPEIKVDIGNGRFFTVQDSKLTEQSDRGVDFSL